jgi:hypothetical protein
MEEMRIHKAEGVSLKLGIQNEYDTDAANKKNNLKYYGMLSLDF